MFYAHFVLSKKGPLARIWLAAHWDKKLTKAHVFETNIDSSVEAIMKPKVKLALRTSGHLLLGVVRIYSRKAKYLLADCNEAFVKIKMAFRPGVVDLPEENREAAVGAITLQENFHDFDALDDLNDIDMQAQFSGITSRPEEITMKEDITSIAFVGDDGFGDVGFDERELLRDAHFENLYKSPRADISLQQTINDTKDESSVQMHAETSGQEQMDVDLPPPMMDDGFGGAGFMDAGNDDDDDNDDAGSFGGGVDQDFFGDQLLGTGNLFEDPPPPDVNMEAPTEPGALGSKPEEPQAVSQVPHGPAEAVMPPTPAAGASGEQTTLITNEEEAFALEPLDATTMPGVEKKKRKRKLIVDEQKGIPSESMKLQLSDTSDIVTTLDLAPPTKKLMHWKETGGVEKLFGLACIPMISKVSTKWFKRNLKTSKEEDQEDERLELESPEITREEERSVSEKSRTAAIELTTREQISTIYEEPSTLEVSTRSWRNEASISNPPPVATAEPTPVKDVPVPDLPDAQDVFARSANETALDLPVDQTLINPQFDEDGPPSIAPFSVGPQSVGPPSVSAPTFQEDAEGAEQMPEDEEQEAHRWTKRTAQMQNTLEIGFRHTDELSFKDMARNLNRKQVTSKFYTLLVLKKHQVVGVQQTEPFGDILIKEGPMFGEAC